MRHLFLVLLLGLSAPAVEAQTRCTNGAVADGGLFFACSGVDFLARVTAQELTGSGSETCYGCLLDVWGWADDATGREYALVGTYRGVAFVDVTEPEAPQLLGYMPGSGRDVKVQGHHAYAGEHDSRGLLAFDLHRLRGLSPSPNRQLQADGESSPVSSHNVVAVEGAPLVASVGGTTCSEFAFYDVSEPQTPVEVGCYDAPVHDAQCLVYDGPDADWTGRTVCFGFNASRVGIVDVTDPGAIVPISEALYPSPGYTHQGWLTEDRRHLLVGDEGDEYSGANTRTVVLDVSDLDAPGYVGAYVNPSTVSTDHNQYAHEGYLYQANYTTGLRILDLADVATADLEEVAFFDTYPVDDGVSFNGAWSVYPFLESGTVLVSDQSHGLFVLRPDASVVIVEDGGAAPSSAGLTLVAETLARGTAAVRLTAPAGVPVRLAVYDLRGRALGVLYDGPATGTEQTFAVGDGLPAGVVLVRAETAAGATVRRVMLVR